MIDFCEEGTRPDTTRSAVMVGCGCKSPRDVISFIKERNIEFVEVTWADEMGLWHHEMVPVCNISEAEVYSGIATKSGHIVRPDPVSARIAPFAKSNTIHLVCTDASYDNPSKESRSALKTKHLNPGWVKMISNQVLLNSRRVDFDSGTQEVPGSPTKEIEWRIVRPGDSPSPPSSNPGSPSFVPNTPPTPSCPSSPESPQSPSSPSSPDSPDSPPSSFSTSHKRKHSVSEGIPGPKGELPATYVLPPLLRPRQVHPTKASRLGLTEKPAKKRRNTENIFCRHCGTKDTPEWRRGPDGRKSLCNACGLHYSKLIKRETLVVPQARCAATLDFLLNPC